MIWLDSLFAYNDGLARRGIGSTADTPGSASGFDWYYSNDEIDSAVF